MAGVLGAGAIVEVNGTEQGGVAPGTIRVRHQINANSTARFTIHAPTDSIVIPAFGADVEIKDKTSSKVLFAGKIRDPRPEIEISDSFATVSLSCVGVEDELRDRVIIGSEGIDVAEKTTAGAQFDALVALLPSYTGSRSITTDFRIESDIRYQTVGNMLRQLATLNGALLSVSPSKAIQLRSRSALPDSALARIGPGHVSALRVSADSRRVRSRQFIEYGREVSSRSITGDGSKRAFLVADTQTPVDYMAAGVTARALNAAAGDQGLRFRADATAAARTGGGIDFFGGNAGDPATGLYAGTQLVAAADVELSMLTDGKLQLRAARVPLAGTGRYGVAIRHSGAGNPVYTTDGITPTINTEDSFPQRETGSDFTLGGYPNGVTIRRWFAQRGDTCFVGYREPETANNQFRIAGFRVSGTALVRDARFDVMTGWDSNTFAGLLVHGDRLHVMRYVTGMANTIISEAYDIDSDQLTRNSGEDWGIPHIAAAGSYDFVQSVDQSKLWIALVANQTTKVIRRNERTDFYGFDVPASGSPTRATADDFHVTGPADLRVHAGNSAATQVGDFLYWLDGANTLTPAYRRMQISTGTIDSDSWSAGTTSLGFILCNFGGRIYHQRTVNPSDALTHPGGRTMSMWAYSTFNDFLEWDAPTADYTTLNTRRQANTGFRVAVIDGDIFGASVPNASFSPIPSNVRSVANLTLNGTAIDIGEDADWRFDEARQKIIQKTSATVLTSSDTLAFDYTASAVAQACYPTAAIARDRFERLSGSTGLTHTQALEIAEELLDRFGDLPTHVDVSFPSSGVLSDHFDLGEQVQFDSTMLLRFGVPNAMDTDKWSVVGFDLGMTRNDRFRYRIDALRGELLERWVDWWRERFQPAATR